MKKRYVILCLLLSLFCVTGRVSADVNDFSFSDFTGDYYLTKDAEGISHLKVVESVTAEFPEFRQNKGICRQIPFTNQDGMNITLPNLSRGNLKVTRNGASEPIYSIEREGDYYDVCTGTEEYVLGTQVYTFEYEFSKVVTDFVDYQELYWDTNGNGATQTFGKVTARLHFEDMNVWTGDSWCYVGRYGESGQDRCTITRLTDGVEFVTKNLKSHENLTFDVELLSGAFVVPMPEDNYVYVRLLVVLGVVCLLIIGLAIRKLVKTREKAKYYKGLFVKPEYQPHKQYDLTEMAEIYLEKKKDAKVAMLLALVVGRKIEFVKGEKKRQWKIRVKNLDGVREEYMDLLTILNRGTRPVVNEEIELKSQTATSRLVALRRSMETKILSNLKKDGLVENKYRIGGSEKTGWGSVLMLSIIVAPIMMMLGVVVLKTVDDMTGMLGVAGGRKVFEGEFWKVAAVMIAVTTVATMAIVYAAKRYAGHTMRGLEMSRYMEGLELYIRMAEAERMKVLQSVKGADTSAEGIVKLYEKLLPYAAVFGLEESWMDEMKEYCKVQEIEEPDYLMNGLAAYEISRNLRTASDIVRTSTVMSSSGGSSSSGFSGGGGGGFSGGGGGGGGFGGR